jgi:hypothetical protein
MAFELFDVAGRAVEGTLKRTGVTQNLDFDVLSYGLFSPGECRPARLARGDGDGLDERFEFDGCEVFELPRLVVAHRRGPVAARINLVQLGERFGA